jgi:hypothetical protein
MGNMVGFEFFFYGKNGFKDIYDSFAPFKLFFGMQAIIAGFTISFGYSSPK